jgi:hypothetical protein
VVVAAIAVLWPKLTHKPGTQPTAVVIAKPAPVNPPAASSPQAQAAAPATQSAAPAQKAAVPPAQPAAPANSATPAGLPPGTKLGEIMTGVAYRGSILRVTEIPADPASCQAACRAETHCVAWTYTQPKAADQPAHCSLKPLIPKQITDACCTSGIERVPDPEFREPPPIPAGMSGAVPGIELEGGTYRYFGGSDATPQGCQAVCSVDGQCLAWDYVRPGVYSTDARCFLKNKSSIQVKSACCIAGFEHQTAVSPAGAVTAPAASQAAAPASSKGPFVNTDLRGSSYRHFDLSAADVSLCQSACKADKECLSWTYVHPSQQNPVPHCWLKNKVPSPSANSCCTSGIERAEAP